MTKPVHRRGYPISDRERDVLVFIGQGKTNKEIGRKLDISPRTVEAHRAALLAKYGVKSTLDLVRVAFTPTPETVRRAMVEARPCAFFVAVPDQPDTCTAGSECTCLSACATLVRKLGEPQCASKVRAAA